MGWKFFVLTQIQQLKQQHSLASWKQIILAQQSPRPYKSPLHTAFNFKLCTTPANLWIAQSASILNSRPKTVLQIRSLKYLLTSVINTNVEFVQDGRQSRIYEYPPARNGGFAGKFLAGYKGILQTDGYADYEQIPCKEHTPSTGCMPTATL